MAKFTEIFSDETKRGHKIPTSEYLSSGKFPIIDQGQGQIAGYTNLENGVFTDVPAIIFGDHTRIIKYVDTPFFLGADGVKVLKAKIPNVDYKYLFYCLQNAKIPATGYNRHFKWLKEIEIPLVSPDEQHRIVAILDKVTDLIAQRRAQLDKLDLLVKSRFVEMFDQCDCYEFLGDANIYISDGNYSSKYPTADEFVDNGVPFIRASNMVGNTISDTEMYYISPQKHEELLKGHLKPYDVLIATRGAIGKIAVVPERHNDSNINAQIVLLRCNRDNYNPIYLSYYLQLPSTQMKIHSLTSGSAQPQLPIKRLVQLELLKPPIVRQNEFSNFAEYLRSLSFYIQQSIDKLDTLKKVLMQQYFGGN